MRVRALGRQAWDSGFGVKIYSLGCIFLMMWDPMGAWVFFRYGITLLNKLMLDLRC